MIESVFTAPFLVQLLLMFSAAGAVYGGIKADLRNMHREIDRQSRSIGKAHERIDTIQLQK